jgi:O-succinylhomoserine sulfhydrylase
MDALNESGRREATVIQELSRSTDRVVLNHELPQATPLRAMSLVNRAVESVRMPSYPLVTAMPPRQNTVAIRTGHVRSFEGEHSEAIFETSSYVYDDCADSEAAFSGASQANVYSRFTNPTVHVFEKRLAALERAEAAVATGSGMAALLTTFMTFLRAGDHVICSRNVFGSSVVLLRDYFGKFGVDVTFLPIGDMEPWRAAARPQTRLLFCETPSNPTLAVADLRALAQMANQLEALLVVDNTFCTPFGQNPLALGAHLVVHSAGKYIDGQGRCIGGVIAGPLELTNRLRGFMRCAGPAMSAHSAWIFLKGLETLQLRVQRHSESAQSLAEWLAGHPRVRQVWYSGLRSHPDHALANRQQRYHGGVLSFTIDGDRAAAWRCIDAVQMISRTTNIGDAKTMITHPASTSHLKLSPVERAAGGVTDNLIRISVGLEDVHDIAADIEHALSAI